MLTFVQGRYSTIYYWRLCRQDIGNWKSPPLHTEIRYQERAIKNHRNGMDKSELTSVRKAGRNNRSSLYIRHIDEWCGPGQGGSSSPEGDSAPGSTTMMNPRAWKPDQNIVPPHPSHSPTRRLPITKQLLPYRTFPKLHHFSSSDTNAIGSGPDYLIGTERHSHPRPPKFPSVSTNERREHTKSRRYEKLQQWEEQKGMTSIVPSHQDNETVTDALFLSLGSFPEPTYRDGAQSRWLLPPTAVVEEEKEVAGEQEVTVEAIMADKAFHLRWRTEWKYTYPMVYWVGWSASLSVRRWASKFSSYPKWRESV